VSDQVRRWERRHYVPGGGDAFLSYVAFGDIATDCALDARKYRSAGVPGGFEIMAYGRVSHGDYVEGFQQGYLWEQLAAEKPALARSVAESPGCVVLRGERKDPPDLDYLRDCIGVLTYLLDNGARVIFDPQMFHWWSPEEWRERVFEPAGPVPRHHVVILVSQDENGPGEWLHTRGMRKFGRPDLSVRGVGPAHREAVIELCNRFIELQAFGGVIPEGQQVRMAPLPSGGVARHGGHPDDPEFNNVHVEIAWPEGALL
jgi:hypothetical protein